MCDCICTVRAKLLVPSDSALLPIAKQNVANVLQVLYFTTFFVRLGMNIYSLQPKDTNVKMEKDALAGTLVVVSCSEACICTLFETSLLPCTLQCTLYLYL